MFQKILVFLDGSKVSEKMLPYAVEQARRFNSKLVLLRVGAVSPLSLAFNNPEQAFFMVSIGSESTIKNELKEAESYLIKIAHSLIEQGLEVETNVIVGRVVDEIMKFTKDHCIDLIVIMAQNFKGRKYPKYLFNYVLKNCGIPILVIPTMDA